MCNPKREECAIDPGQLCSSTPGGPHFNLLAEPERMIYKDVVFPPTYRCLEEEGGWTSFSLEAKRNYWMQGCAHLNIFGDLFLNVVGWSDSQELLWNKGLWEELRQDCLGFHDSCHNFLQAVEHKSFHSVFRFSVFLHNIM